MYELSKQFHFDSAHTLERDVIEARKEASRRVHGHTYRAKVTLRGAAQPQSGMVVDLDVLERAVDGLHDALDHRMLNDIEGLEMPTMENLCRWIWQRLAGDFPNLVCVAVYRDSNGEECVYHGAMGDK